MARPTPELIEALRRTARSLKNGAHYQWGNMGGCNCGNLAQELTKLTKDDIHRYAMQGYGDWSEQVEGYCDTSFMPIDLVISEMLGAGLTIEDLQNLERLADKEVLSRFPTDIRQHLKHNNRADVIAYMNAWAEMLEEQFLEKITLSDFAELELA